MEAKRSEKINKNKRYNTYLVHSNYHQIWKNNKMPTERERERERFMGNKVQMEKEKK